VGLMEEAQHSGRPIERYEEDLEISRAEGNTCALHHIAHYLWSVFRKMVSRKGIRQVSTVTLKCCLIEGSY
jgi:hypothetical protein